MVPFSLLTFTLAFILSLSQSKPLEPQPWLIQRADSDDSGDVTLIDSPLFGIPNGKSGDYTLGTLTNNPPERPDEWVGMGDSFAAGPGAGTEIDKGCKRGSNAYPKSMQDDDRMPGPGDPNRGPSKPRFTFTACTGDVTTDLNNRGYPNYQLKSVGAGTTFVTLSIGGNDVKFADILEKCVFGQDGDPDCNTRLQNGRNELYGPGTAGSQMWRHYTDVLYAILENMQFRRRYDWNKRTAIYITSYPQFFDSYTTQCNNAKFVPRLLPGPKMTQDLRKSLNRLTHEVNYVIQYWIDVYNWGKTVPRFGAIRYGAALDIVDQDLYYDQHRFCRDGVNEPDRDNRDTWFFHYKLPLTTNEDKVTQQQFDDDIKNYGDPKKAEDTPTRVVRTFHPKSAGHQAARDFMFFKLNYNSIMADPNGLQSKHLDIVVAGDSIPFASADPRSPIYEGFIPHLSSILRDRTLFPNGVGHDFLGSQQAPYLTSHQHECYPGARLDDLYQHYRVSLDMKLINKVILLSAGTYDVMESGDDFSATTLVGKLRNIIELLFSMDSGAVIFVAQIPMVGSNDDGHFFATLQRRVIEYNAEIAAMVNELRTQKKRRIMKIHTTATTYDHYENSFTLPSAFGYERIAYDFLQGMVIANNKGWLEQFGPRKKEPGPEFPEVIPTPTGAPTKSVSCAQERPTNAPDAGKLTDSFFLSKSQADWVAQVACNEKVLCQYSRNGDHPKLIEPFMNEGTDCLWSGGLNDEESNYYQFTLRRPDPKAALKDTQCSDMVNQILDTCITKGKYYGGFYSDGAGLEIQISNLKFPDSPLSALPSTTGGPPLSWQSSVLSSTWSPPPTDAPPDATSDIGATTKQTATALTGPTDTGSADPTTPTPTETPTPTPTPTSTDCPDAYPDALTDGLDKLAAWMADVKNNCDKCPGGKSDFCAIGGNTCQCTEQKCVDEKRYMCWK